MSGEPINTQRRPITPMIVGSFYSLASLVCASAGISLLLPRGAFDWMWAIKPAAYERLRAMAPWSGLGFCLLALAMAITAVGCFRRRRWGWLLAVAIFTINGLADAARLIAGDVLEGLIGTVAAGAIVYALLRPNVRGAFAK